MISYQLDQLFILDDEVDRSRSKLINDIKTITTYLEELTPLQIENLSLLIRDLNLMYWGEITYDIERNQDTIY